MLPLPLPLVSTRPLPHRIQPTSFDLKIRGALFTLLARELAAASERASPHLRAPAPEAAASPPAIHFQGPRFPPPALDYTFNRPFVYPNPWDRRPSPHPLGQAPGLRGRTDPGVPGPRVTSLGRDMAPAAALRGRLNQPRPRPVALPAGSGPTPRFRRPSDLTSGAILREVRGGHVGRGTRAPGRVPPCWEGHTRCWTGGAILGAASRCHLGCGRGLHCTKPAAD